MKISFNLLKKPVEAIHVPLIEIIDNRRVLIENHVGIIDYGDNWITVKKLNGGINIIGTALYVSKISKEQIVINGQIEKIELWG